MSGDQTGQGVMAMRAAIEKILTHLMKSPRTDGQILAAIQTALTALGKCIQCYGRGYFNEPVDEPPIPKTPCRFCNGTGRSEDVPLETRSDGSA